MSELEQTRERLDEILVKIPVSGSFEAARLSKEALELGDKLIRLYAPLETASKPEAVLPQPLEKAAAV